MTTNKDDKTQIIQKGNKSDQPATPEKASGKSGQRDSNTPADDSTIIVGSQNTGADNGKDNPDVTVVNLNARTIPPASSASSPQPKAAASAAAENRRVIKGRFELVSMLGAGGMGAVYKALDRRKVEASDSDPYVAVKLLNDDFRQHPDAFISLQRESRKSQTLAHPNIVTVYDFDRDRDTVFMTMEFLEGSPLDELLRKHPDGMEAEKAESILRDISNALIYAHSHNIIHSDFKPGNIYVTNKKGTKVFDFGIARAVSEGSAANTAGEKTIFDASTLGALTPAYASKEMLDGSEPSQSDDVYALGCVAYELYCGKHPFNKMPADQAFKKGLKPKRLKSLSRRQWNALAAALEFTRENRTATVAEFYEKFFGKPRVLIWALATSLIAFAVVGGVYLKNYNEQAEAQEKLKEELQLELQTKLESSAIDNQENALDRLMQISALTPKWDAEVRRELRKYNELVPDDGTMNEKITRQTAKAYVDEARRRIENDELKGVTPLLQAALRWDAPTDTVNLLSEQLNTKQEAERLRQENARLAVEREKAERMRIEQEQREADLERARQQQVKQEVDRLEDSLRCPNDIDVAGRVADHLHLLESLDPDRSAALRTAVASSLTQCFNKIAKISPYSAASMLEESKALLPDQSSLDKLKVDYCGHIAPGTGAKGRRYTCADPLPDGAKGPSMVVVPSPQEGKAIAISEYEITYDDIADFCRVTERCDASQYANNFLPLNNINIDFANNFADWLSSVTGQHYRLPEYDEWLLAAKADGAPESADRNCFLKYGAIEKGTQLRKTTIGRPNSYGLVSHVGNVQEWAYRGSQLVVAGGSRQTPMDECRINTVKPHNGSPDEFTGFRLVRETIR
ncbi:MAG: hypothetical protein CMH98_06850 [Oceanospirillaceae bacterium]|nr:hypothetical protein [Oceanospirillaceae bacterium]|tara:strand:- start:6844 stop:9420 length:2577 start_codon:yes stop_codon:yes gene_type:complete